MTDVEPVDDMRSVLGEGPVWSARFGALFWVDIVGRTVHRRDDQTGEVATWQLPSEVGSLALCREADAAVVALRTGFHRLDFATGEVTVLCEPGGEAPGNRFNDGKCDRQGRFWAGSMDDAEVESSGRLYRLDADGQCAPVLDRIVCSNGLGWSPDDRLMYYTDTYSGRIDVLDFDPATGAVSNRRTFVEEEPDRGLPDGLAVDAEGYVWGAKWDGWRVVRYAPSGAIDRVLDLPVPRPTSCTFGGPDLDRLYITSARRGMGDAALERAPLSGAVFVCEPGVRGLPEPEYAG